MGLLANAFGPLEPENFADMRRVPHARAYRRLREFPLGVTNIGVRDLYRIFGHHHPTHLLAVYLEDMQNLGMLHCDLRFSETGRLTYMHITVHDRDSIPEHLSRIEPGTAPSGDGLSVFLRNFSLLYRAHTKCEWPRTGKEVGVAKHLLAKKFDGDAVLAVKMAKRFFNMPLEQQPDDMGFMSFSFMVDKLLAHDVSERRWEEARSQGERAARRRAQEPTAEDDAEFMRQSEKNKAEAARLRRLREEEAAREAEDNAL